MISRHLLPWLLILAVGSANQAHGQAQSSPVTSAAVAPTYADLADMVLPAPLIVHVEIAESIPVDPERVPQVPADMARIYLEADVQSLIRGRNGLPASIRYVIDLPRDARGRAPRLQDREFLIFAQENPARPGEVQLIAPDAQIPWSPEADSRVRGIAREAASADSPPAIIGIREALHIAGNLTGEGETQIFLATDTGDPVSLTVLRRPGLAPQWAVSLTEIVDSAATVPAQHSLLWYQLACGLPRVLPDTAMLSESAQAMQTARQDYQFILDQLGPCARTR